ncbi:MAG: hypothetical protein WDN28_23200 [Chthoniobacter sp.]
MISQKLIDFAHHREADWIDILSRELHVLVAAKLRDDPNLLSIPLHNLRIWKHTATPEMKLLFRRWKLILMTSTPEEILDFLTSYSAEARTLRAVQSFLWCADGPGNRLGLAGLWWAGENGVI